MSQSSSFRFGGGGGGDDSSGKKTAKDFASQFHEAMTPEEKEKLFEAIDYQVFCTPFRSVTLRSY